MKMDKNLDGNGEESPPRYSSGDNARQSAAEALDEILEMFTSRIQSPPATNGYSNGAEASLETPEPNSEPSPSAQSSRSDLNGIDPSSPLGRSLQMKFTELEEISRRLKTRLNQVVCEADILLSPDADAGAHDTDLEWDLNTDSRAEDLTPQEFFQLIQSHASETQCFDSPDNSDDISK